MFRKSVVFSLRGLDLEEEELIGFFFFNGFIYRRDVWCRGSYFGF